MVVCGDCGMYYPSLGLPQMHLYSNIAIQGNGLSCFRLWNVLA